MIYLYCLDTDCSYCVPEDMKETTIELMKQSVKDVMKTEAHFVEFPTAKEMYEYISEHHEEMIKKDRNSNLT